MCRICREGKGVGCGDGVKWEGLLVFVGVVELVVVERREWLCIWSIFEYSVEFDERWWAVGGWWS
jgi:hypothetical protein